jgi:hypothetical protein
MPLATIYTNCMNYASRRMHLFKYVRDYFVNGIKEMNITFEPEPAA